jgi:hypothetical protein
MGSGCLTDGLTSPRNDRRRRAAPPHFHARTGVVESNTLTNRTLRQPAYRDLAERIDQCGLTLSTGKAVAAAFVGTVAATLAVAEPIRRLHSGPALAAVGFDLRNAAPRYATTDISPLIAHVQV